ncbi:MAG: hypothetical protein OER87_00940 [Gammaproteobacteria bacterium]|nr:hypothetical protein [Gammaproteobacteria bacterium]MDH3534298.1 hypothetical protein [Gammaproteobacteria bacterium]
MVKTYSRRALLPYTSQIQVAETPGARALSLDGRNWEIQYLITGGPRDSDRPDDGKPVYQYARVASVNGAGVMRRPLHPLLDAGSVNTAIDDLVACVSETRLPYQGIDKYEYWLLDAADGEPLALLNTCISNEEVAACRVRPVWLAIPAAQLDIADPRQKQDHYVPPVNYSLQKLVEQRAGQYPQAAWFERSATQADDFPPCLVTENWEREDHYQLCHSYIRRMAPRLLMLQGLPRADRQRLELAARENAVEADWFYPLYPEIVDKKLMTALRVEAKLRRTA